MADTLNLLRGMGRPDAGVYSIARPRRHLDFAT